MDSQYYQEFLTLVETKNFWEASERLFIGESSLSKHISRMEMELGVKLFDRSSRRVELTKYGKLFIPFAEQIVRAQASYKEAIINAVRFDYTWLGAILSVAILVIVLLLNVEKYAPEYMKNNEGKH